MDTILLTIAEWIVYLLLVVVTLLWSIKLIRLPFFPGYSLLFIVLISWALIVIFLIIDLNKLHILWLYPLTYIISAGIVYLRDEI